MMEFSQGSASHSQGYEKKDMHMLISKYLREHSLVESNILSFNDFGLVAITRKRVKQSLERTLCQPCTYCSGSGWVKSVTTVCYEILAEVRKMARHLEGDTITLRVNPDVGKALKSREGIFISEMESSTHKDVVIKNDPAVHQERFEIY